jgi:hypothetical protein
MGQYEEIEEAVLGKTSCSSRRKAALAILPDFVNDFQKLEAVVNMYPISMEH